MSGEALQVFIFAFGVWGALVAFKAARAVTGHSPYVFSIWDGGMLRAGKRLPPLGAKLKILTAGTLSGVCWGLLAGAPFRPLQIVAIIAAVASVLIDFAMAEGSE